ncbi:TetR family transcriptional regulator [Actinomadura napierensis]
MLTLAARSGVSKPTLYARFGSKGRARRSRPGRGACPPAGGDGAVPGPP